MISKETRHGISKELADKIDIEYDDLLKTNPDKLFNKEKKANTKELVLKTAYDVIKIKASPNGETVELKCNGVQAVLDRNQAYLLYLYLKERFGQ